MPYPTSAEIKLSEINTYGQYPTMNALTIEIGRASCRERV